MRAPLLAAILSLAACSPDYSAVRDWSYQARDTLQPATVTRVSTDTVTALRPPSPVTEDGRLGAALALREGASAWLALLAYIADDGLPRQRENPLAEFVPKVRRFDAAGAEALDALGEKMGRAARRNWRAPYLSQAVEEGDPAFQGVLAALRRQLDALPDAATQAAAVERIAEGHALLVARSGRLSRAETAALLQAQEEELRRLMRVSAFRLAAPAPAAREAP
jgi:hypothetical protein